jgi:site-specific DNA recombinase
MKTTKAIGYVRVSTDEQATEGVSLAAQRAKIEAYAVCADLELVAIVEDAGISGKKTANRPGLQKALSMLEDGAADALVVFKLDRLSRSTRDVLDLADAAARESWALHSLSERLDTSSAAGRFVLTILAALAEMERAQIGERTAAALSHIRSTGRKTGGTVPYGFDVAEGGKLVPNESEQATRALILDLSAAGSSFRKIADELNGRGIATKTGAAWTHVQVSAIVKAGRRDAA